MDIYPGTMIYAPIFPQDDTWRICKYPAYCAGQEIVPSSLLVFVHAREG